MAEFEQHWPLGPDSPHLGVGGVHVWSASLDQNPMQVRAFEAVLTSDERARAERFRFEKHRRRFIVGRGWLRSMLARYLNTAPQQLEFFYGSHGKPALTGPWAGSALSFNLSHSEEMALLAVTHRREIGVDVEWVHRMVDGAQIAERFFSEQEWQGIYSLPTERQDEGFFHCWTRKEAYLKAVGDGLSHPLNLVIVTVKPDDPARFVSIDNDPVATARWSLAHLAPATGYVGAVVVEGQGWQLSCWHWSPR